jgi:hypothetical protein
MARSFGLAKASGNTSSDMNFCFRDMCCLSLRPAQLVTAGPAALRWSCIVQGFWQCTHMSYRHREVDLRQLRTCVARDRTPRLLGICTWVFSLQVHPAFLGHGTVSDGECTSATDPCRPCKWTTQVCWSLAASTAMILPSPDCDLRAEISHGC